MKSADCERVHDSMIFHVCLQFYATKDVEDAKSANREDAPERSMISIGFSAVLWEVNTAGS